ncbi:PREDICTED: C4b-binding protein alpha chain isoform X1 [Myotis brandtii]|uniref:C4b-binding protein alpha chain isoform X1 n=1 Tax=Myotis brandtii TaxID=109478 RepID=UPI000703D779|nr:PREDICTED: C4b-binding protein alpha chain isoform X1 [Myotis brandtii]
MLRDCGIPPDVPNATPDLESLTAFPEGSIVRYYCDPGYAKIRGKVNGARCLPNGEWTKLAPFCNQVCCPLPQLKHGKIILQRQQRRGLANKCEYFYGDLILYSCDGQHNSEASCQEDGTWSPETPTCEESCYYPPVIDHGRPKLTTHTFSPDEAKYECDRGYILVGNPILFCIYSRWSGPPPQCKAVCPTPEIEHGNLLVDKDQFVETENVTIQCDSGYGIVGPQNITCLEDRTWYPEVPKCEWEVHNGCEQVVEGSKLMQCLPSPMDVKMALEVYKLSLEIKRLKQE